MARPSSRNILKRYFRVEYIQKIMNEAIKESLVEHKKAGNKVPVWENGRIVYVEPITD